MKTTLRSSALVALLALPLSCAPAQQVPSGPSPFALSLDAGTTGIGGSLWITASDRITLTLGYGVLDVDEDYSTEEADYSGTAELANGHAWLNWHPFAGAFHLSAGGILADNRVEATAVPAAGTTYEFNGVSYPAALVGNLQAEVELADGLAPFVGLGWATSPRREGLGFFATLGVMFSGSIAAELSADGPLASDPTFQANLAMEEEQLQDELDKYEIFPVVRLGVMYRF